MHTTHVLHAGDARVLAPVPDASVHLVVTSPPYPLIAMWDEVFTAMDPAFGDAITREDAPAAFASAHAQLDRAWAACLRVLVPGGLVCINIGDATRSLGGEFALWPNHARITQAMLALGANALPDILWRKPTNAPNKFMGSGMLPPGAYATYEHEYILVFRKGGKRVGIDAAARRRSAYFWEERNRWFSDMWADVPGRDQALKDAARERSAAFPLEIPWRLIHMFSVQGETVLDPFAGTGTTALAAMGAARSSVGVDLDPSLASRLPALTGACFDLLGARARARLAAHREWLAERAAAGKLPGHHNAPHDLPVMTSQEEALEILRPADWRATGDGVEVDHVRVGLLG